MTYFVEVERGGIGEEDCHFHFDFKTEATKAEIEQLVIEEDCGYDPDYCRINYYQV